jgi:hypothetical protein
MNINSKPSTHKRKRNEIGHPDPGSEYSQHKTRQSSTGHPNMRTKYSHTTEEIFQDAKQSTAVACAATQWAPDVVRKSELSHTPGFLKVGDQGSPVFPCLLLSSSLSGKI